MNFVNGLGFQQYLNKSVYSIQYPGNMSSSVGMGKITEIIKGFEFAHTVDTYFGSSGSPIVLSSSNNVIGIHKACCKDTFTNYGTFLGIIVPALLK